MSLQMRLLSSLDKVYPDEAKGNERMSASMLRKETFSFQIAFQSDNAPVPVYPRIQTDLPISALSEYLVGYVPVMRTYFQQPDSGLDRIEPGLFPDPLYERHINDPVRDDGFWSSQWFEIHEKTQLTALPDCWQSLLFTVNGEKTDLPAGKYRITVQFLHAANRSVLGEKELRLEVLPVELPSQNMLYTSWFHCDCLCDLYGVRMFSKEHFRIMESFIRAAADTGMNMILLPAFTPPLDTPVNRERKTAQLVDIWVENGQYRFDFSRMKRFTDLCRACGITHFEHSHLFTQWGAKHAPKIVARVGGKKQRLFGWETDSQSQEYVDFLEAYFTALRDFLSKEGLEDKILFHVSDEPNEEHLPQYRRSAQLLRRIFPNAQFGDAISHYDVYRQSGIDLPIVVTDSQDMELFCRDAGDFWVYYTGEQLHDNYSNRVISVTGARCRILGIQMYVAGAKGFLHWGYNYYYATLSHGLFDPMGNPCGYGMLPGTSYMVYAGTDRKAIPSIRMKQLYEGFIDYRALEKLEEAIGRRETLAFVRQHLGEVNFRFCPENETLLNFREKLNQKIKEAF